MTIHSVSGQNTTTVSNGVIHFSSIPTIGTTQSDPNNYTPESNLATLYSMARGFTNAIIPGELPYSKYSYKACIKLNQNFLLLLTFFLICFSKPMSKY